MAGPAQAGGDDVDMDESLSAPGKSGAEQRERHSDSEVYSDGEDVDDGYDGEGNEGERGEDGKLVDLMQVEEEELKRDAQGVEEREAD